MTNFSQPQDILSNLQWRYATKQFDASKKIDDTTLETLLEALHLSPSSFGLQPWRFIVITDDALRQQLQPHSWNQPQIVDCSHLVVICARKDVDAEYIQDYVEHIANTRGVDLESLDQYKQMMTGFLEARSEDEVAQWARRQTYISLGFLLSTAANLGVDACPMEGIDPAQYDSVLELEDTHYTTGVAVALGYRATDDKYADLSKVRFERGDIMELR